MKKIGALLMVFLGLQFVNGQVINVNGVDTFFNLDNDVSKESDLSPEVLSKKYLTEGFKPASIDNQGKVFFLRYNIYENEMEFAKDAGVYYMRKAVGTRVHFRTLKTTYECFEVDGKLLFYQVYDENDSSKLRLITKQSVRYTKAEKAINSYDVDKPAKYTRRKDEQFFVLNNEVYEIPRKKKDFYAFFKTSSKDIKDYMKKEKLGYKDPEDLTKIVEYYNQRKAIK